MKESPDLGTGLANSGKLRRAGSRLWIFSSVPKWRQPYTWAKTLNMGVWAHVEVGMWFATPKLGGAS